MGYESKSKICISKDININKNIIIRFYVSMDKPSTKSLFFVEVFGCQ